MTAVGLGLLSALLFGAMSVGLRIGLGRWSSTEGATVAVLAGAFVVTVAAAACEAPFRGVHTGGLWPFALSGVLQPGVGQLLFTLAVREIGASRTSVVFGSGPLFAVTIALLVLGEPLRAPLIAGAVLVVAGGVALAAERDRPGHLRPIGLVYALGVATLFAARDNLLRWLSERTTVPPAAAACASLLAALVVLAAVLLPRVRERPPRGALLPFLLIGGLYGLAYVALFEAYYRGRVTVVSPLVATESLWGVVLSVLLIRQTEAVSRRLVVGALLIVAGGALIGVFR